MTKEGTEVRFDVKIAEVRIYHDGQRRFGFVVMGDHDLAVLEMGEGKLAPDDRSRLSAVLKSMGFTRVAWDRERPDGTFRRHGPVAL